MCAVGPIRVFRIFKTNPYQNNSQIFNNPYNIESTGNPYHVAGLRRRAAEYKRASAFMSAPVG